MDNDLVARRDKAESSFNELTKQREQKLEEIKSIETEQAKLQGEYRLIEDLLNKKAKKSKVSPQPDVIDVDAAVEEKKSEWPSNLRCV